LILDEEGRQASGEADDTTSKQADRRQVVIFVITNARSALNFIKK
jgi:hypothetical protein